VSGKKILIIDDDPHLLLGLTPQLKGCGFSVVTAADAIAAISMARREVPDLIILDLGLPAGDGFQVLERIKNMADLAAIPVIVLTAWDPVDYKQRSLDAGAVAFFQKPPVIHEFLTTIHRVLGEEIALSDFLQT
jgi:putative two-component system response regulator